MGYSEKKLNRVPTGAFSFLPRQYVDENAFFHFRKNEKMG
jgi:hypothetical protein